jgi:hypothetical protein
LHLYNHSLVFFTLFITEPLWIKPEKIKNRDALLNILGNPKHIYSVKGFVAWEKGNNYLYSTIELRDGGLIVTSNILKKGNLQVFKNSKVWDGTNLYQYITVWPYGRFRILVKE